MEWEARAFVQSLHEAAETFDRPEVERLCAALLTRLWAGDDELGSLHVRQVLAILRRKRYRRQLQAVADACLQTEHAEPEIGRAYVQALLDQGDLSGALWSLTALLDEHPGDDELQGLVGRAHKQRLVRGSAAPSALRVDSLNRAVAAYHVVYAVRPARRWHGINVVALLCRAQRDGLDVAGFPDPLVTARAILDDIKEEPDPRAWDLATAAEAALALDDDEAALGWLDSYVQVPEADAFEIASTLRQLTEVWQLDFATEPGALLLPLLHARLLQREGGELVVGRTECERTPGRIEADETFERILGGERYQSLQWLKTALERGRAVARIENRLGEGVGTGFLASGAALAASLPERVFVTNAHVVSEDWDRALPPTDAVVAFLGVSSTRYEVAGVLFSSPPERLDVTVLSLTGLPEEVAVCPVARRMPMLDATPPPRAYVIGYPRGVGELRFSIHDSAMIDYDDRVVHYRSPTEPGSSGSPVFNREWSVIGLHHAGSDAVQRLGGSPGIYAANEGIRLDAIQAALQDHLIRAPS